MLRRRLQSTMRWIKKKHKRSQAYKNMLKRNKRHLDYLNRKAATCPWDWAFGLEHFMAFVQFMYEYYTLGENIFQSEESLSQVISSLRETLDAYYDWQDFGYTVSCDIDEYNKEYNEKREKFFKLLSDNIEYWWD